MEHTRIVVVGAGQSGLSAAHHLRHHGLEPGPGFVVLDHAPRPGGAWQYRWPTLTYGGLHGMHSLPGMELTGADPDRPSSEVVGEYFDAYERAFGLRVLRPVDVSSVRDTGDGRLLVTSSAGEWSARGLINATGTWDRPFWPYVPGRESFAGRQLHTASYPGPEAFAGRRVIVVGGGTSAVQHLLEISGTAAETTWVTRRPPVIRDTPFDEERGRAVVALVADRVSRGLPPQSVVSVTGLVMTQAVREARERGLLARRPMFRRIVPEGVVWDDGTTLAADTIVWATGFRAAVDHLAPLGLREPGGGIRLDGTGAVRDPRVHLVGYGPSASTVGASRAGRAAVHALLPLTGDDAAPHGRTAEHRAEPGESRDRATGGNGDAPSPYAAAQHVPAADLIRS
ncbi:NAD(P)-binding domain-containing protein [Streptomyces sp. NPDC049879]|uniref:NAD(P)-binding domain-containing protein n=1 Tax=Streptomyces sp. NPDC049879 TaxID=3365598 RepID=UPI00379813ED